MPVRIRCPHCQQDLRLPEELYEGPAQCPCCGGGFAIRWHQRRLRAPRTEGDDANEGPWTCPFCRQRIPARVVQCPLCGERLEKGAQGAG